MWSILRFNITLLFSNSRACKLWDYRWSAKALSASIRLVRGGGLHLQPVQCSAGLTVHLHTCSEYLWQLTVIARDQDTSFIKADVILPLSAIAQGVRQQKMAVEARMQETGSRRAQDKQNKLLRTIWHRFSGQCMLFQNGVAFWTNDEPDWAHHLRE